MTLETIYIAILSGTAFVSLGLALTLYNRTNLVADTLPFKILRRSKLLAGNISMATTILSLILLSVDVTNGDSGIKCMMLSFFYLMGIQWVWMVIPLIAPDFLTKKKVIIDASIFLSSMLVVNFITNGLGYNNKFVGITFAVIFISHCGYWVVKFGQLYRRAMIHLEEEYSDYIFLYIDWTYDASLAIIVFCLIGVLLCYSEKMTIAIFFFFAALAYFYVVHSLNKYQIHAERLYFSLKRTEEEKSIESIRRIRFVCAPSINVEKTATKEGYANDIATSKVEKCMFSEESPIAQRIKKWIDEEGFLQSGLTLNDIANKIGTNRTYVSGFINTTYHCTFFEFIANLRVEKIKKMLMENPDRELEYLSNTCGFSSSSHMSSTFKKITGETLNEHRKRIKKSMEE
ncbi:MAG: helix-turn-helix domain-containing protein [Bacteroidales bacterium]|jgi:AraC-like DNA-binding protein|nr:helix-turn-helix domain-containing protein [Bacteroidales bacterium]